MPWYLRWLGFKWVFELEVLDEPTPTEDGWVYTSKITQRYLKWMKFKIKM